MAKLIIDYKAKQIPLTNDILVYDKTLGKWKEVSQKAFLTPCTLKEKQIDSKMVAMGKEIASLSKKIEETNTRLGIIANLIKEDL